VIGVLTVHLRLAGCSSLKEKRGRIKPVLARLRREFNVAVAEVGLQDSWQETVISCVTVGNEGSFVQSALSSVLAWIRGNWPDGMVEDQRVELIA
jgi:uncharacterized protein